LNYCTQLNRLGERALLKTHRSEKQGHINSLARSAGVSEHDLPYKALSLPALATDLDTFDIGFDRHVLLPDGGNVGDVLDAETQRIADIANVKFNLDFCWKKLIQGAGVLSISIRSPEYPGLV
jgi:hypothetical protein